jgi:hypothetical protein
MILRLTRNGLFVNSMENRRRSGVVPMHKTCWMGNMIDSTPKTTKRAMIWPLPQAYRTPPKDIAMRPDRYTPQMRTAPIRSSSATLSLTDFPGCGSCVGIRRT